MTPEELLQQSLQALRHASRFSGNKNSYRKDNPAEYGLVIAYLDGGTRPNVTTEMGRHAVLDEDVRRSLLVEPEPEPPPGDVLWVANGTTGTDPAYIIEKEWSAYSDDSAGGSGPITAPWTNPDMYLAGVGEVLAGKRSYRVKIPSGETRHEIKMAHPLRAGFENRVFSEGQETWLSWALKIADYVHPNDWWMVNQFRHVGETGMPTGGSPHGLAMKSGPNWLWTSDPNIYPNALWDYNMGVPVVEGQVLKVTFHAKWSTNPAIGFMEVFLNAGAGWVTGFPKRMQATLLTNSATGQPGRNHMRFGTYRSNAPAAADSYMAGLVCATTREKAESVAFK